MRSRRLAGWVLAVLAAAAACGPAGNGEDRAVVRAVLLPYLSFAPLWIAAEEGFFAGEGLELEIVELRRAAEAVPALARGGVDVLAGTLTPGVYNAIARGARIRVVAEKGSLAPEGCSHLGLVVRRDLVDSGAVRSPEDLAGRRISIYPASFSEFFLHVLLARGGLTVGDVEAVDLPAAAALAAFEEGALDAEVSGEPWLTRSRRSGAVLWARGEEVLPGFPMGVVLFGPSLLAERPEAGRRFLAAYRRGVVRYGEGKTPRNLEILARVTGLERGLLEEACWPAVREDLRVDLGALEAYQRWALGRGFLDRVLEPGELWEPGPLEAALRSPVAGTG